MSLLTIENLSIDYDGSPRVRALDHVSLTIEERSTVGIAGESGCGKSTMALAIMGLLENATVSSGSLKFQGRDLLAASPEEWRHVRWEGIAMVAQNAMNALNPVLTVGQQLTDVIFDHRPGVSKRAAMDRAQEVLRMVELDPRLVSRFPHELSGGMRQRAMIAMALVLEPTLIIMDEPTTALDVVVQAQILKTIQDLQRSLGFAILFITHDISLLLSICNRIAIMYAGEIVEEGPVERIATLPAHPYTRGLLAAFPSLSEGRRGHEIGGSPPDLANPPAGCRFYPRCSERMNICANTRPSRFSVGDGHWARCFLLEKEVIGHDAEPNTPSVGGTSLK